MKPVVRLFVFGLIAVGAASTPGLAQSTVPDLAGVSIEDLMNIRITSVSHKSERVGDVAAAVYVVTQDDIRRSGMTTVPELLRLVPGVQVARINSNKWAVSIRGFNNLFADKLLVLIDGRTVYDRLNSGLFWESLDVPLDQIDRIEVVRGPGGATWGANAVSGVINIVTRTAADTPGGAFSIGAGTLDGTRGAARYGGNLGAVAYRVYSQWAGRGESALDADTRANDRWESQTHGFRLDWSEGRDTFLAEGGATFGKLRALFPGPSGPVPAVKPVLDDWSYTTQYDVLGRWTRRLDNGASLQVQSAFDFRRNDDGPRPTQIQTDVDAQYHDTAGRHDMVIGAGYRRVHESVVGNWSFSIAPGEVTETVVNLFAQDEIALGQVRLTLGAKLERDSYVGWGVQPTARLMWTVVPRQQHVWGSISRALRTPSLADVTGRFNFTSFTGAGGLPVVVGAVGNPDFQSEEVVDTEIGYRYEIGSLASIDVTGFVGHYDKLKTSEPLTPRLEVTPAPAHLFVPVRFANLMEATASGIEVGVNWTPVSWSRLSGAYSTFHLTPHLSAASGDAASASFDGNAPESQWQARTAFSLPRSVEIDLMLFHAGALPALQIGAYTRTDLRVQVPLARRLSLSIVGQNLFDPVHGEYAGRGAIVLPTLVPRSASITLLWRP